MTNLYYSVDNDGYLLNFVIGYYGHLPDAKHTTIENFNRDFAMCYREVDGALVWDEQKYQSITNPTPIEPQPSELDILKEQVASQQAIIDELLFDVIPALLPITDEEMI